MSCDETVHLRRCQASLCFQEILLSPTNVGRGEHAFCAARRHFVVFDVKAALHAGPTHPSSRERETACLVACCCYDCCRSRSPCPTWQGAVCREANIDVEGGGDKAHWPIHATTPICGKTCVVHEEWLQPLGSTALWSHRQKGSACDVILQAD